jgi:NDP-sugar pyrophosphorylase family protein
MYAFPVEGYHRDIGTPESYRRAQEEWPGLPALDEVQL